MAGVDTGMDPSGYQAGRGHDSSGSSHPWQIFLSFIFPIPLVFLVLLSLPFPKRTRDFLRRFILGVLDKIALFKIELGGASVTLIAIIIIMAALGFIFSVRETLQYREQEALSLSYLEKKEIRCKRWRSERNFWISLLGLVLWLVLACVRVLILEAQDTSGGTQIQAKEQLIEAQTKTIRELQTNAAKLEQQLARAEADAKRNK